MTEEKLTAEEIDDIIALWRETNRRLDLLTDAINGLAGSMRLEMMPGHEMKHAVGEEPDDYHSLRDIR